MIADHYKLKRFLDAQQNMYDQALKEIQGGKKNTHWMWFVFPQFRGLGSSQNAIFYAINCKEEAIEYFNHHLLGTRLKEITRTLLELKYQSANSVFGSPDDLKLKSSMTLFSSIQTQTDIFELALEKYFSSSLCERTLRYIGL